MIGAIKGTVIRFNRNPILLMVGGVGYSVSVPSRYLTTQQKEKELFLYTYTYVREDALDLYGFLSEEELTVFTSLLTVSGVGPKTALLVLDNTVPNIISALKSADVDFFTAIPRLGKKNAQKIIIELKNKIGSEADLDLSGSTEKTHDLLEGLMSMGFSKNESMEAIRNIPGNAIKEEDKFRFALKHLKKHT